MKDLDAILKDAAETAERIRQIEEDIARTDPWFLIHEARRDGNKALASALRTAHTWKQRALSGRRRVRELEKIIEKLQARVDLLEDGPLHDPLGGKKWDTKRYR